MNSLFLCFTEISLSTYILISILFSVLLANFRFYNYPSFLSALSTFSIFVLISLLFLIVNLESPSFSIFFDLLISSPLSSFALSLILLFGSFLLILNRNYFSTRNLFQYEFDILLNFSFLGLVILCLSNDFLVVYTAIELQSLAFYILAAFRRDSEFSNEAGIKYFVLGSFSSCFLLLGFSLVYFSMGSTSFDSLAGLLEDSNILLSFIAFIFIVVALFFKLGAAPFHMWVCDVYEGSLLSVTAFFAIIPKVVILFLFFKVSFVISSSFTSVWFNWFSVIGLLSIATGSIVALYQKRTKRLLAYSAISHVGFILLGASFGTLDSLKVSIFYITIYMIMNLGIFSLLINFSNNGILLKYLINWSFLKKWNIILALTFSVLLFSTAGIPPLAGFYSKLSVISVLVSQEKIYLSLAAIILSCIGCFYYIRLIKILFFGDPNNFHLIDKIKNKDLELCLGLSLLIICCFLLKPNFLLNVIGFVTLWLF